MNARTSTRLSITLVLFHFKVHKGLNIKFTLKLKCSSPKVSSRPEPTLAVSGLTPLQRVASDTLSALQLAVSATYCVYVFMFNLTDVRCKV